MVIRRVAGHLRMEVATMLAALQREVEEQASGPARLRSHYP